MFPMLYLFLIPHIIMMLTLAAASTQFVPDYTSETTQLATSFSIFCRINQTHITVQFSFSPTGRWFAVGFGTQMIGSNAIVYEQGFNEPPKLHTYELIQTPGQQFPKGAVRSIIQTNWVTSSDILVGTNRTVIATRKLQVTNKGVNNQPQTFTYGQTTLNIIYAFSEVDTFHIGYHGQGSRGTRNITLTSPFTINPTKNPTDVPTLIPTNIPSNVPYVRRVKSRSLLSVASTSPSDAPTVLPSNTPSSVPTLMPTNYPSSAPSSSPSVNPSNVPSFVPTSIPTENPSRSPSAIPSFSPTNPTNVPTFLPSGVPSSIPTNVPSTGPISSSPTRAPTRGATLVPLSESYTVQATISILHIHSTHFKENIPTIITQLRVALNNQLFGTNTTQFVAFLIEIPRFALEQESDHVSRVTFNCLIQRIGSKTSAEMVKVFKTSAFAAEYLRLLKNKIPVLNKPDVVLVVGEVKESKDQVEKDEEDRRLRTGEIAAIIIGCVAVLVLAYLAFLAFWGGEKPETEPKYEQVQMYGVV